MTCEQRPETTRTLTTSNPIKHTINNNTHSRNRSGKRYRVLDIHLKSNLLTVSHSHNHNDTCYTDTYLLNWWTSTPSQKTTTGHLLMKQARTRNQRVNPKVTKHRPTWTQPCGGSVCSSVEPSSPNALGTLPKHEELTILKPKIGQCGELTCTALWEGP